MSTRLLELYNFLDSKLLPRVSTDAAAFENYEVTNLISENSMIKSRGFLAYTSIKPPIDIDFELICPISLRYITIGATIGTQKSIGIEILGRNLQGEFVSLAHATFNEARVVFYNSRYYNKKENTGNCYSSYLKSNTFRVFINLKFIKVRIFRTERSVPCLGSIEVWGLVSKCCPAVTLSTINKLMRKKEPIVTNFIREEKEIEEFEIPEDFKDALTMEIMAIPMTLPSGHTVDQNTLEKCISNDASYGRQGCDPFTGLNFIETRKPKLNVALKSRIDMFLLENSDRNELIGVKRTVGRLNNENALNKCNRIPNECKINKSNECKTKKEDFDSVDKLEDGAGCSLDEVIAKVMTSGGFMCFTKDEPLTVNENKCITCDICDNLYVLPCQHKYCRMCLLNVCRELICRTCKVQFSKSDICKLNSLQFL